MQDTSARGPRKAVAAILVMGTLFAAAAFAVNSLALGIIAGVMTAFMLFILWTAARPRRRDG